MLHFIMEKNDSQVGEVTGSVAREFETLKVFNRTSQSKRADIFLKHI